MNTPLALAQEKAQEGFVIWDFLLILSVFILVTFLGVAFLELAQTPHQLGVPYG